MERFSTEMAPWRPVREGMTLAPLKMAAGTRTFLMRYEPGSRSPSHTHPGGEEIYVIAGRGRLDDVTFDAGDFIYTPAGKGHTLYAETEAMILVMLPMPAVITE